MVRTWTGQVARAAGASLIAPLALLAAAGVLAAGGGLGSFGALRELASGPSLPDVGLAAQSAVVPNDADTVAPLTPPDRRRGRVAGTTPAPRPVAAAPPRRASVPVARTPGPATPPRPPTRRFKLVEPDGPPPSAAAPTTPPAPPPTPVDDLLEVTQGVGTSLGTPLRPLTDAILNLLRGPPPGG